MEIRVLEYFLTVVQEESISAAADLLHVTQPTLSRQLIDLEKELGVTLLNRGRYGVTLTHEGMILRKRAEQIVDLVSATREEVTESDRDIGGEIRLGCAETVAFDYLAGAMHQVRQEYPGITFRVMSSDAYEVIDNLNRGLYDFGLLLSLNFPDTYDYLELPHQEKWGLLMKSDDPLAADSLDAAVLLKIPLIVSRQWEDQAGLRIPGQGLLRRNKLNIVSVYNLAYNASRMVKAGLGYALIIDGLIDTSAGSGLTFKPLDVDITTVPALIWNKHRTETRAGQIFKNALIQSVSA